MGVALGLIAIALAGAAGEPKSGGENVQIQYTVRFLETEGMGWREAVFTRLTPVTRQGAATVWTAPGNVRQRLLQQALEGQGARLMQTPVIKGWTGAPVHFSIRDDRRLVTQVAWDGNDRPAGGMPETVRTGPVGTMAGRKIDQGVLVQLVLEDTEIRAIHRVPLGGSTEPKSSPETKKAAYHAEECTTAPDRCRSAASGDASSPITGDTGWCTDPLGSILRFLSDLNDEPQLLAIPVPGGPEPSGTISQVQIDGDASIPAETIKAKLLCRAGQPIDSRKINTDLETLRHTRWFSDVEASYAPFPGGKNILYFTVQERHVDRAAATLNEGSGAGRSTASTDCACEKDGVIQAHLETASPASACCASPTTAATGTKAVEVSTVSIEVPEIASQEIAGEWLIPKDGILLVSFGPHTVAGKDGKAVIRERLAIIEAGGIADGAVLRISPTPGTLSSPYPMAPGAPARPRTVPAPIGAGEPPGNFPALPSRSIPQGVHADGTPAELPTLPPDDTEDASSSESAEPRPSPQTKKPQPTPKPAADSQMKRTGFNATSMIPAMSAMFMASSPTVGLQFLMPIKAVSFRLPFNRRLEIEIFGRVVRNPEPAEAPPQLVDKPKTSESR